MASDMDPFDHQMWGDPPALLVEVVMNEWTSLVAARDPWRSMPLDDQGGEMRRVLGELLDGGGDPEARQRRIHRAATNHGMYRRAQRCAEAVIAGDFAVVREALREGLRQCGMASVEAGHAVAALSSDCHSARHVAHAAFARAPVSSRKLH